MCRTENFSDFVNPIILDFVTPTDPINQSFKPGNHQLLMEKEARYDGILQENSLKLPAFFKANVVKNKKTRETVNLNFHPLNSEHIQRFGAFKGTNLVPVFQQGFVELMNHSYNIGEPMAVSVNATHEQHDERSLATFIGTMNNPPSNSNYTYLITLDPGVDAKKEDKSSPIGKCVGFLGGCDNFDYIRSFIQRPFQNYSETFNPIYEVLRKLTFTHYFDDLKKRQAIYLYRGSVHQHYQGLAFLEKLIFLLNAGAKADGFTHSFGEATNAFSSVVLDNLDYQTIAVVHYGLFTDSKGTRPFAQIQEIEEDVKNKQFRAYEKGGVYSPTTSCVLMVKAFKPPSFRDLKDPFTRRFRAQDIWARWSREDIGENQLLTTMDGRPGHLKLPSTGSHPLSRRQYAPDDDRLLASRRETDRRIAKHQGITHIKEGSIEAYRLEISYITEERIEAEQKIKLLSEADLRAKARVRRWLETTKHHGTIHIRNKYYEAERRLAAHRQAKLVARTIENRDRTEIALANAERRLASFRLDERRERERIEASCLRVDRSDVEHRAVELLNAEVKAEALRLDERRAVEHMLFSKGISITETNINAELEIAERRALKRMNGPCGHLRHHTLLPPDPRREASRRLALLRSTIRRATEQIPPDENDGIEEENNEWD